MDYLEVIVIPITIYDDYYQLILVNFISCNVLYFTLPYIRNMFIGYNYLIVSYICMCILGGEGYGGSGCWASGGGGGYTIVSKRTNFGPQGNHTSVMMIIIIIMLLLTLTRLLKEMIKIMIYMRCLS